jgi:hypothetical protein
MAARFASWERRYPDDRDGWSRETRAAVRARADRLERDICRAARVAPDAVGRLAWTGEALERARRESAA